VTRADDPNDCVFCVAQSAESGLGLVVHDAPLAYVILNLYP
jgi:hypothetical protein